MALNDRLTAMHIIKASEDNITSNVNSLKNYLSAFLLYYNNLSQEQKVLYFADDKSAMDAIVAKNQELYDLIISQGY